MEQMSPDHLEVIIVMGSLPAQPARLKASLTASLIKASAKGAKDHLEVAL